MTVELGFFLWNWDNKYALFAFILGLFQLPMIFSGIFPRKFWFGRSNNLYPPPPPRTPINRLCFNIFMDNSKPILVVADFNIKLGLGQTSNFWLEKSVTASLLTESFVVRKAWPKSILYCRHHTETQATWPFSTFNITKYFSKRKYDLLSFDAGWKIQLNSLATVCSCAQ